MREIKFRAWDTTDKKMLYTRIFETWWYLADNRAALSKTTEEHQKCRLNVMQFIGKTDRNDKDIYEGDIIQDSVDEPDILPRIGCIVWDDNACGFMVEWTYNGKKTRDCIDDWDPLIIGNIHKDKNLLEG